MHTSYLDSIRNFEGYAPRARWDYKQSTNGFGTKALYSGEIIDRVEAERRFRAEIARVEDLVERFAPDLNSGTKAALTSLTYNAGTKWMQSGLGESIRSGNLDRARQQFLSYNKAGGEVLPGLVERRLKEASWIGRLAEFPQETGFASAESVGVRNDGASGRQIASAEVEFRSAASPVTVTAVVDMDRAGAVARSSLGAVPAEPLFRPTYASAGPPTQTVAEGPMPPRVWSRSQPVMTAAGFEAHSMQAAQSTSVEAALLLADLYRLIAESSPVRVSFVAPLRHDREAEEPRTTRTVSTAT